MHPDNCENLKSQSIYQIFPRNFSAEGTLDAIIPELPRIASAGFDIVYLTPIHPIGQLGRKGPLGSPYAIADYRQVDPALGGEPALKRLIARTHELGLRLLIDVVFNHTAPDSLLAREHPEWFLTGPDGQPTRKVADWSDVVDLDFSKDGLRQYLFETLEYWLRLGVDGFRCDVASLVPLDFWIEARRRAELIKPTVWLAESVHKEFVAWLRSQGWYAASDGELHAAFDLTYDYDGRPYLEDWLSGARPFADYLEYLRLQDCLYPAFALKARNLENHDQPRIASLVPHRDRLRNITALWMLLPGTFFAYMGQDLAIDHKPDLFSRDPLDRAAGDNAFAEFFVRIHLVAKALRKACTRQDWRSLGLGLVYMAGYRNNTQLFAAVFNLDGRRGQLTLDPGVEAFLRQGHPVSGAVQGSAGGSILGAEPLIVLDKTFAAELGQTPRATTGFSE